MFIKKNKHRNYKKHKSVKMYEKVEEKTLKSKKKCWRKQKRAQHRLSRDMNVECADEPTQVK